MDITSLMYSKELTKLIKDQTENVKTNIIAIEFRKLELLEEKNDWIERVKILKKQIEKDTRFESINKKLINARKDTIGMCISGTKRLDSHKSSFESQITRLTEKLKVCQGIYENLSREWEEQLKEKVLKSNFFEKVNT